MIPLYIIIPVTGIILLFKGFNADKGHGGKNIGFGVVDTRTPINAYVTAGKVQEERLVGTHAATQVVQTAFVMRRIFV